MSSLPAGVTKGSTTLQELAEAGDTNGVSKGIPIPNLVIGLHNAGRDAVDSYTFAVRDVQLKDGSRVVLPKITLVTDDPETLDFYIQMFTGNFSDGRFDLIREGFSSTYSALGFSDSNNPSGQDTYYILGIMPFQTKIPSSTKTGADQNVEIKPFGEASGAYSISEVGQNGDGDRLVSVTPLSYMMNTKGLTREQANSLAVNQVGHENGHQFANASGQRGSHSTQANSYLNSQQRGYSGANTNLVDSFTAIVAGLKGAGGTSSSDPLTYGFGSSAEDQYNLAVGQNGLVGKSSPEFQQNIQAQAFAKLKLLVEQYKSSSPDPDGKIRVKGNEIDSFTPAQINQLVSEGFLVLRRGKAAGSGNLGDYDVVVPGDRNFKDLVRSHQDFIKEGLEKSAAAGLIDDQSPQGQNYKDRYKITYFDKKTGYWITLYQDGSVGHVVETSIIDASGRTIRTKTTKDLVTGLTITSGTDVPTRVKLANSPGGVDFVNAGEIIGSQLGAVLAGKDKVTGVVLSATLKTIGSNLGDLLNLAAVGSPEQFSKNIGGLLGNVDIEFLQNLKSAGVGALSSFVTAELINALGIDGFAGEIANSTGGAVIGQIATNIADIAAGVKTAADGSKLTAFSSVGPGLVVSAAASFIGSKLANEIKTFGSIGGQIGAAVGGAIAGIIDGPVLMAALASGNPVVIGVVVVAAIIDTILASLIGGFIGSIFGGTPRSGADVEWDESKGGFVVANAYSKKGGSKDAASGMASSVAETFNGILTAVGGDLIDPQAVQAGNYGMRKQDYVYRPTSSRDKDDITQRFSGQNGASRLINYGIYQGLTDPDFKIVGGDIFVKRALYNSLASGQLTALNFDQSVLLGNIVAAQRYSAYLTSALTINALVMAESNSVLAVETALTIIRAGELGLTRRSASDWYGGFSALLTRTETSAAALEFSFGYDTVSERISREINLAQGYLLEDTIDIAGQTVITGTAGNDVIRLAGDQLLATNAGVNAGLAVNGAAFDGQARLIDVAATVYAGAGDDNVQASDRGDNLFGEDGNDTLYGGRLDDWLIGGAGNDILDAGGLNAAALGGDGNYLEGGIGNDILRGREGSDWLEGGDGVDQLTGGAGDDVLAGGAGAGDTLLGGAGADQYLIRRGDGADFAEEVVSDGFGTTGDAVAVRMSAIEAWKLNPLQAGAVRPDWLGTSAGVTQGQVNGGEDALVFGLGIEIGDIRLQRSGTSGAPGADLIVVVTEIVNGVEVDSGARMTVKDWFSNPFKRVEWLKFADGTEVRIGDITSFVLGGAGNDVLVGTTGNDFVYGGAGNDRLFLLAGDDIGNGGTGDDFVAGDAGRDLMVGGLGADKLMGGKGADAITGDGGADDLYGGDDNDILSGGRGDGDLVVGGAGDDRFKFARGDGHDTIMDDFAAGGWSTVWANGAWGAGYTYDSVSGQVTGPGGEIIRKNLGSQIEPDLQWLGRFDYDAATSTLKYYTPPASGVIAANNGVDTLEFAPDIRIQDVVLRRIGNDLQLVVSNDGAEVSDSTAVADSVTIKNWFSTAANGAALAGQIEKIAFYQTGVLDVAAGRMNLIAGSDGIDGNLFSGPAAGTAIADWFTGGTGNDRIATGGGDDIVSGGVGADTLRGETGNDVLYGGVGNDILDGGQGRDVLAGGAGFDTATYVSSFTGVRVHLSATFANSGDAEGDEYSGIEALTGTSGADVLGGDAGQTEFDGGSGDDLVMGGAGDDTYIWAGGAGNDVIHEGAFTVEQVVTLGGALAAGYTTTWTSTGVAAPGGVYWRLQLRNAASELVYDYEKFVKSGGSPAMPTPAEYVQSGWTAGFARTNGQQVTRERFDASIDGGVDVLEIAPGLTLSDMIFSWVGDDLYIARAGASGQMRLQGQKFAASRVEVMQLGDGQAVSLANVMVASSGAQLVGTSGDDLLAGRSGALADDLAGGAGNDALVGYDGDDRLFGGDGDDILEGGFGADLLDGGANTAAGTTATAGDTVRYSRTGFGIGLVIDLNLTTAQAAIDGADSSGDILIGIENVIGFDGYDTLIGDAGANRLSGLDGSDTLRGGGGDDVLLGGVGFDTLYGDAGNDALAGEESSDQLWGGDGDDRLDGNDGFDALYGEAGDDSLTGGTLDDTLDGGAGKDVLLGGEDNDTLVGGDGDDTLSGDAGMDSLQGGLGADAYVFGEKTGSDTLVDASGANTLNFDKSVSFDRIWMVRAGADLKVSVIGGDTVVTVSNFFAATGASLVRAVQTETFALYLDNDDTLNLVTAMTAASAATPTAMPADIAALLGKYWHAGGHSAPVAPTAPRVVNIDEDVAVALSGAYGVIDHDRSVLVYSIKEGAQPSHGVISALDPATGALTYTPTLNYNGADEFVLLVTDTDGTTAEVTVQVGVRPVNDNPDPITVVGGGPLSIAESAPGTTTVNGSIVGKLAATDPDGNLVIFSLADTAGGRFAIDPDGTLRVANAPLLDRETSPNQQAEITVVARDGSTGERTNVIKVNITNINEAPFTPTSASSRGMVSESSTSPATALNVGGWVARFNLTDPDANSVLTVRPVTNPYGLFKGVGAEIQFAVEPDFETLVSNGLTVTTDTDGLGYVTVNGTAEAYDGALTSAPVAFSVKVKDTNQQHTVTTSGAVASIDERDRVAPTTVRPQIDLATLTVNHGGDNTTQKTAQYNYAVYENGSSTASTRFAVSNGKLVLLSGQSLNYETEQSISLIVRVADTTANPLKVDLPFIFTVIDQIDITEGGTSADVLYGQTGADILRGVEGNDTLYGGVGNDELRGGDGNDVLNGEGWNDRLYGENGDDVLDGGAQDDILWGGIGNDNLWGGLGNDTLYGEEGDESGRAAGTDWWRPFTSMRLGGGDGNDFLYGGNGEDYIDGGLGADAIDGGMGIDGVTYETSNAAVTVDLKAGTGVGGSAQGDTLAGIEYLQGSIYNDTLTGADTNDAIYGGAGIDTISGGLGNDMLFGGDGNDVLSGGLGNDYLDGGFGDDTLQGGDGNDTYFIARGQGADLIRSFDPTGADFDHLTFDGSILYTDIWFDRVDAAGAVSATGANVRLTILGTSGIEGSATIENWFTAPVGGQPDAYFKVDLISDGGGRITVPIDVDALTAMMMATPAGSRPTNRAGLQALRDADVSFRNRMEDYWRRLTPPKISDIANIATVEPLDGEVREISIQVRAWYADPSNPAVVIPASNIDIEIISGVAGFNSYFTMNAGAPDANGNRTVKLTLSPNLSTAGLPGGVLPLQMIARIRGTNQIAGDLNGFNLQIAPTADTAVVTPGSTGGQAGVAIPIILTATDPDNDGSERIDVLIAGLPPGYSFIDGAGNPIGVVEGSEVRLTAAQRGDVRLVTPVNAWQDAILSITPLSIDGASTRRGTPVPLRVSVNGKPTSVSLSGSINENAASNTFVGTLLGVDPDASEAGAPAQKLSYMLLSDAGGRYKLDPANNSRLLVANGGAALFDYEAANRAALHTIKVRVTDASGAYVDQNVVVTVNAQNETPNAPSGPARVFLDETGLTALSANAGTIVSSYGLSDPDGPGGLSLAFQANPNGWFYIQDNAVKINPGLNFDFEWARRVGYDVADWNADGRSDAYMGDIWVTTTDGIATSAPTLTQLFISNVNERPNNLGSPVVNLFQETTGGDSHALRTQAQFSLSDPDEVPPELVILGGNDAGWFRVNGSTIEVNPGVNWTADWVRAVMGAYGSSPASSYDTNGNQLKEVRVATLKVAAKDASGAYSDPFTFDVLIEDKNEAPVFTGSTQNFYPAENPGYYQYLGSVQGSDVDGPSGELRFSFTGGATYFDTPLNRQVSRSVDSRFVMDDYGAIFVNGSQTLDYEAARDFSYGTTVTDRARGANAISSSGTSAIHLQNVDEQHAMHEINVYIDESNTPLGPFISRENFRGMLSDPEGGANIRYEFDNGSSVKGGWQIDSASGEIWMVGAQDYEAITDVYEEGFDYDEYGNPYSTGFHYVGSDDNRAWARLGVRAINTVTNQTASANLNIKVQNVDEAPTFWSAKTYYGGDGQVIYDSPTAYRVTGDKNGGGIIQIYAADPEHQYNFTYSISDMVQAESIWAYGGSSEIDSYALPYVYIDGNGLISFTSPGEGNGGEWEGGTKIDGVRRTSTVRVSFNLNITDATNHTSHTPFLVTFVRRGASVPPLVLDLDGDGVELTPYDGSTVLFDMDGDGVRDKTGWVGSDDGLLALDRNGNGTIDDIGEISFVGDAEGALSDLEGLRAFDTDGDNFLDADDARFGEFRIWQDANHDGVSQASELKSLSELGVTHIGLTLTRGEQDPDVSDNVIYGTADFTWADGTQSTIGDVFFAYGPSNDDQLAAPIILDLDGDGKTIVSLAESSTTFDMVGDGRLRKTAWADAGDAFLVRDRNGDGVVNGIAEISFIGDKAGAKTDLEGLAGFDENGDGVLDARDVGFVGFGAWIDANSNGVTDAGELLSLAQAGISSIDLKGVATGETAAQRTAGHSVTFNTSKYVTDTGGQGLLSDVGLAYDPTALGSSVSGLALSTQTMTFDRKAKKFRISTADGALFIRPHKFDGALDATAGQVSVTSLLSFRNGNVGLLSPIVLDLDGDGVELKKASKSKALFDMDGDGVRDDTGWIGKGDGLLVIDRDGDGLITKANELSFLAEKADAKSGFEGLAVLDANKDGKVTAADARFGELKVWVDADRDGATDSGELKTLSDLGISEIGVRGAALNQTAKLGSNMLLALSTFKRLDGSVGTAGDSVLAFDPSSLKTPIRTGGQAASDLGLIARLSAGDETTQDAEVMSLSDADLDRLRVLQMTQAMSSFGSTSAVSALTANDARATQQYDYFASATT
jgi:Ca2+-binding RTX toxin-like protein